MLRTCRSHAPEGRLSLHFDADLSIDAEFTDPDSWPTPAHTTTTETTRYGAARARCWDRLHPRLTRTGAWTEHEGPLPIMEGTVIRLQVDLLPGSGTPKPFVAVGFGHKRSPVSS